MAEEPQGSEETQDALETTQDTPEAPETDSTDAPENWQERYEHLQPEYTRASQEAAQYRQLLELAQQGDPEVLNALGWETADDGEEEDEEHQDEDAPMTRAEFQEYLNEQNQEAEAAQQEQEFRSDLNEVIEQIEADEGRTLSDQETRILVREAQAQEAEIGTFDLTDAWEELQGYSKAQIDRYVNSKREAQLAPLGSAGDKKIDFNDEDARREQMAAIIEADAQRNAEES